MRGTDATGVGTYGSCLTPMDAYGLNELPVKSMQRLVRAVVLVAGVAFAASAAAQGTAGRSSSIVIPVAAKTSSFETETWVRNPNSATLEVDVLYYEANGLPSPGLVNCGFLSIVANSTTSFKLGTQCPSLATGSHFGLLILRDRAAEKTHSFGAYSRVQHVNTNQGFSIEGFPEHVFSGRGTGVIGLKRIAASNPPTTAQPGYTPNCFVASLAEPVNYTIDVVEGFDNSVPIGSQITGSLAPHQMVRYVDIIGAAGGPAGDKQNVRVVFNSTTAFAPYVAFCTMQDNLSFGADFRIAKSNDDANITKLLTRCRGTSDPDCTTLTNPATYVLSSGQQHRWSMFIHHPDHLRCDVVGPNSGDLEIRLLAPSPSGSPVGPPVAGGSNQSFFYHATGSRNSVPNAGGFQTFWTLEVGTREGVVLPGPVGYGLKCVSGSGIHLGSGTTAVADDF